MSNYRYTAAHPVNGANREYAGDGNTAAYANPISPLSNTSAYGDEHFGPGDQNAYSKAIYNDPNSPFFGMDPQLAGFVQKYNVVMDDGAVVNMSALASKTALEAKQKKQFRPPWGLTLCQFVWLVVGITLLVLVILAALVIGLVYGLRVVVPSYPAAEPWWRRTQMYQVNVETWANDVGGGTGRLEDVIPRMAYLSGKIGATSVVLTQLVAHDVNGITNWLEVSASADLPADAVNTVLPKLVARARQPLGGLRSAPEVRLLLGLPLYATSSRHPWFLQGLTDALSPYASYYIWTTKPPATPQEHRYYAYSEVRRAYYRHCHGNPDSPLLNLSNVDVQKDMKQVLQFWKTHLKIKGIMITNSTNVIPEMYSSLRIIVNDENDEQYMWFADDQNIDKGLNMGERVCFFVLVINNRVPTRSYDLTGQINKYISDPRLATCTPIWSVTQLSAEHKDFDTVQKLARFLPGNFLMMAGQEVYLTTGNTESIQWQYTDFDDYTTYWPVNINLPSQGQEQVDQWHRYQTAVSRAGLLATDAQSNLVTSVEPVGTENLLVVYRTYLSNGNRVYFIVSFQTLNTEVSFQSVFSDLTTPTMTVAYDAKNVYHGRLVFKIATLINNQVLLLEYY